MVRTLPASVRRLFMWRSRRGQVRPDQGDDGEPVPTLSAPSRNVLCLPCRRDAPSQLCLHSSQPGGPDLYLRHRTMTLTSAAGFSFIAGTFTVTEGVPPP